MLNHRNDGPRWIFLGLAFILIGTGGIIAASIMEGCRHAPSMKPVGVYPSDDHTGMVSWSDRGDWPPAYHKHLIGRGK